MMYEHGYSYGGGNDIIGFIFMLFMMVLVIIGVIVVVRHLSGNVHAGHHHETAQDLLKKRYAKGEIDKKEYEEIRKDLAT